MKATAEFTIIELEPGTYFSGYVGTLPLTIEWASVGNPLLATRAQPGSLDAIKEMFPHARYMRVEATAECEYYE